MLRAKSLIALSLLAVLNSGCSGKRLVAQAQAGIGFESGGADLCVANEAATTNVTIAVLDRLSQPVGGVNVTFITNNNGTYFRSTQGDAGVDHADAAGSASFTNVRGPICTAEAVVEGIGTVFSRYDLVKGWDPGSNTLRLTVRNWTGSGSSIKNKQNDSLVHDRIDNRGREVGISPFDYNVESVEPTVSTRVPTTPNLFNEEEIRTRVHAWLAAWERGSYTDYSSFYSSVFMTPEWMQSRKNSVASSRNIRISISNLRITELETNKSMISFNQRFVSSSYADYGTKTIIMVRSNNRSPWLIVSETWEEI